MTMRLASPNSILITGGSGGLGAALTRAYAAPGVNLALTGRHAQRLEQAAADCRNVGATVRTRALDVLERERLATWMHEINAAAPLDLVIRQRRGFGGHRRRRRGRIPGPGASSRSTWTGS